MATNRLGMKAVHVLAAALVLGMGCHTTRDEGRGTRDEGRNAVPGLGLQTGAVPSLARYEFAEPQMGVPFRIVLYAASRPAADEAARAAFSRIAALNAILSDYEDESELNRLSRTAGSGRRVPVSVDLWRVLARGQEIARRSGGAFDMTAGPCVQLWRRARRQRAFPEPGRIEAALSAVGYRHLKLGWSGRKVQLGVERMRLDLGGIAKGYALQEAFEVLERHGCGRALVTGGGDMVAGDPPPGARGWRVELAPLDVAGAPPARHVWLRRRALATSGDYYQHVELGGRRYSHVVDPRTGVGLTDHSLVTVIARDGMTADALATAVSVLGPGRGLALVAAEPGTEAQVVRAPDEVPEVHVTRGWDRVLER